MKLTLLTLVATTLWLSTAHADANDEAYLRSVVKPETQIVVIGEWHMDPEVSAEEVRAITAIKNIDPSFDCFFSELDHTYAEEFTPFNENRATYEETIGLAFANFEKEYGPANNLLPKVLAEGARAAGLRIVPVDVAWKSEDGKTAWRSAQTQFNSGRAYLEHRTQIMAEAAAEEMKAGRCTKGVFVIGANHVFKAALNNGPVHSIDFFLAPSGLATQIFKISKLTGVDATPILP